MSQDGDIFHITRGGQVDERYLFDQLPPCREWQRASPRCFLQRRENYPYLLSDVRAAVHHFAHLLPGFDSVLRRSQFDKEDILREELKWKSSWSAFVPRQSDDTDAFQTIAFTQVLGGPGSTELERRSCAFPLDCIDNIDQCDSGEIYQSLVLKDVGKIDGIERILFSFPALHHWSTTLLLTEAIRHFLKDSVKLEYGKVNIQLNVIICQ